MNMFHLFYKPNVCREQPSECVSVFINMIHLFKLCIHEYISLIVHFTNLVVPSEYAIPQTKWACECIHEYDSLQSQIQ